MKGLKRSIFVVLFLCLLSGCISAKAAENDMWRTQYTKILANPSLVSNYLDLSYINMYHRGDFYFNAYFLCDVDNNGIPELFMCSNHDLTAVLTCTGQGRIIGLSIDSYYKINNIRHVLVVKGHWHGAGGSGIYEYSIYKIVGSEIKRLFYIDKMSSYRVYKNEGPNIGSRSKYSKVYKKFVDNGKPFENYRHFNVNDRTGLSVIQ